MYDLIIMGGGPAGVAAGVYAARKKIKSLLITESFGGQSEVSAEIQNWIGTKSISGFDLARALEEHIRAQKDIDIVTGVRCENVVRAPEGGFTVATSAGETYTARALIVATGSRRRTLDVPGEKEFSGRGVAYCATCDAPLFQGKKVAVVGGGNAGLEAAADLIPYAAHVYLLARGASLKGDAVTQEKIQKAGVETFFNAEPRRIVGDADNKFIAGLEYYDKTSQEIKTLPVEGVFVEIGAVPNTEIVKDIVLLNEKKEIIIDHRTGATSVGGIWAAGDATDAAFKQNNISAGDAVKAALSAYAYLQNYKETLV